MLGGSYSSNPAFPVFMEENHFQTEANVIPQLQLFGDFPVGWSVDPLNYMGNEHATATNGPIKRIRGSEPTSRQQKLNISLNDSFRQDEAGPRRILNPNPVSTGNQNPVSTGLKLSYEEDERNSSITSASDGMKAALPGIFSLSDSIKVEIDRQKEEFDHYIRLQEAIIMKGVRDLKQRHTACFLNALEKGIGKKLQEKDLELESINSKNKELGERIKQAAMEAQTWHYRAKYTESVVNALKSNLQQAITRGTIQAREGCGDSEVDDAASYVEQNYQGKDKLLKCRACKGKEVSVLLIPCRHLCLCMDCEGFIDICPVCQVMKTASVQVLMS